MIRVHFYRGILLISLNEYNTTGIAGHPRMPSATAAARLACCGCVKPIDAFVNSHTAKMQVTLTVYGQHRCGVRFFSVVASAVTAPREQCQKGRAFLPLLVSATRVRAGARCDCKVLASRTRI